MCFCAPHRLLGLWVVALSLPFGAAASPEASPETPEPSALEGPPRPTSIASKAAPAAALPGWLRAPKDWPAGDIDAQLARDPHRVPFGKGAVFVPAMVNPLDEPPIAVLQNGDTVAEGTTGQRIALWPGTYELTLGSGSQLQRMHLQVTVKEGLTTVVPSSWSGLTVHVVDEHYGSLRASYELIRVSDREHVGIGFGSDEQAGEPVSTWILTPGLYKLVRLGENYRARRDFSTVRLVPGKHTHFMLVVDPETGSFLGGGEVPARELFTSDSSVFGSLLIGGDLALHSRNNDPSAEDGWGATVRGFIDSRVNVKILDNPLLFQLQLEEGQTKTPGSIWSKSSDRLDIDLLYIYRLASWIGPYVRLGAESNLLPTRTPLSQGSDIYLLKPEAPLPSPGQLPAGAPHRTGSRFRNSPSFGLISVKEGLGLNLRALKTVSAELSFRAGLGARHRITRDLYELAQKRAGTAASQNRPVVLFREIPSDHQIGMEGTVLATARFTRWVLVNLEVDTLIPFSGLNETIVEGDLTVGIKLTRFASINYVLRYLRDPAISDDDRVSQDVLLRLSLEVF